METDEPKKRRTKHKLWGIVGASLGAIVVVLGLGVGYIYTASPEVIRRPLMEHYHFRMQVIVNGKAEDFSAAKYQTGYSKDQCNGDLATMPFHFHDNKDQFVHVHWEGVTGGQLLKYYGWNFVGGLDDALGYRFDNPKHPQRVPLHGDVLPVLPTKDVTISVYVGDEHGYKLKNLRDFTTQDLETFFGKTSNFPAHNLNKQKRSALLNALTPRAYAHNGEDHSAGTGTKTEEELTKLNNLLGNVVIFVQQDAPTDAQIKARFNALLPLSDSTCGG